MNAHIWMSRYGLSSFEANNHNEFVKKQHTAVTNIVSIISLSFSSLIFDFYTSATFYAALRTCAEVKPSGANKDLFTFDIFSLKISTEFL